MAEDPCFLLSSSVAMLGQPSCTHREPIPSCDCANPPRTYIRISMQLSEHMVFRDWRLLLRYRLWERKNQSIIHQNQAV